MYRKFAHQFFYVLKKSNISSGALYGSIAWRYAVAALKPQQRGLRRGSMHPLLDFSRDFRLIWRRGRDRNFHLGR